MRWMVALVLVGCTSNTGGLDMQAPTDMRVPVDMQAPMDFTTPVDLARPDLFRPDLTTVVTADMTQPEDLTAPDDLTPPEDLTPPADLTPCGGAQQPCCPGDVCSAGTCMRRTSDGLLFCVVGSCGGYRSACCTLSGGTTFSGSGLCTKNPTPPCCGQSPWMECHSVDGCK